MYPVDAYERNGIAFPVQVLPAARAAALAERVVAVRREHSAVAEKALGTNCHLLFPWLFDLVHEPAITDAVAALIGPDVLAWSAGFFFKEAGSPNHVTWHQDSTYWGLEPTDKVVTAWIALTPSTEEAGCMQVVPGSHARGQQPHIDKFADGNMLSRGQEVAVEVTPDEVCDVVLQPGQMSLHHVLIFHGSGPNTAPWPRVGFAIRYIPAEVRQVGGKTYAKLVRGSDRYGHFLEPERPDAELSPQAWKMHQRSLTALNDIVLRGAARQSRVAGHTLRDAPAS